MTGSLSPTVHDVPADTAVLGLVVSGSAGDEPGCRATAAALAREIDGAVAVCLELGGGGQGIAAVRWESAEPIAPAPRRPQSVARFCREVSRMMRARVQIIGLHLAAQPSPGAPCHDGEARLRRGIAVPSPRDLYLDADVFLTAGEAPRGTAERVTCALTLQSRATSPDEAGMALAVEAAAASRLSPRVGAVLVSRGRRGACACRQRTARLRARRRRGGGARRAATRGGQ